MTEHLLTNVGVYAFVIKNKKLLMLHKPNDPIWAALGGRMEKDEKDPILSLKREVKEEIGIDIEIEYIFDVKLWSTNEKDHRIGIFYICKLKNSESEIILSKEHDKYNFFSYEELITMSHLEERGKVERELFNKLKDKTLIK